MIIIQKKSFKTTTKLSWNRFTDHVTIWQSVQLLKTKSAHVKSYNSLFEMNILCNSSNMYVPALNKIAFFM